MTPAQPAIDPTLLALLSIFGGVAITVIAGLVGALLRGRGEHKKWLREARMETYVQFLQEADKVRIFLSTSPRTGDLDAFRHRFDVVLDAEGRLSILGPDSVYVLAMNVHAAMTQDQTAENTALYFAARNDFVRHVRPLLGIRNANFKKEADFTRFTEEHALSTNIMGSDGPANTVS